VVALVSENARTQSIVLDPLDWPGHLAGRHVDVRLTAEDGYQAQRSYSIASAPEDDHLMLNVERLDAGDGAGDGQAMRSAAAGSGSAPWSWLRELM
jgi:ferredoxin-NADP reductase